MRKVRNNSAFAQAGWCVGMVRFTIALSALMMLSWPAEAQDREARDVRLVAQLGHAEAVESLAFSPDGSQILTGSGDGTARLWDIETAVEVLLLVTAQIRSVTFSPDGSQFLTGHTDRTARLWDTETGKEIRRFEGHLDWVDSVAFSPDGSRILTGSGDGTARLWDIESGKEIGRIKGHSGWVYSVAFSPDGSRVLTGGGDDTARLWDTETGKEIRRFEGHGDRVWSVAFSPDGSRILTGSSDGTARLWDTETGKEIRRFEGHTGWVLSVAFSPDGSRILTGSEDTTARLWDTETGEELCQLISFSVDTWAVTDPEGRFDSSSDGDVEGLHYVAELEPIALNQLKDRFYTPGLLAKIWTGEPLPNVSKLTSVHLYPELSDSRIDAQGHLELSFQDQGGGIGAVEIYVDGKIVSSDARPRGGLESRDGKATLALDLRQLAGEQFTPGVESTIEVKVRSDLDEWLVSRGLTLRYTPKGVVEEGAAPRLFALCVGVSDYTGNEIDLRYADKDAEDFGQAVEVAGRGLFGDEEGRVNITVLTTDPSTGHPSRSAIIEEMEGITDEASVDDVIVVYLAGHGVTLDTASGDASEVFHFLTADATTAKPYRLETDDELRATTTISSEQLAEILNDTVARKRVVVLDTCAAGAAFDALSDRRDIPTDQIRALSRLKDRTGMWVLGGCASDSVSFEASRFAQGVLTRSLLLGMRGGALPDDGQVDVSRLFEFAADTTPDLAAGIGGIQRPQIFRPTRGSASFPIGLLADDDARSLVPLERERPVLVRSNFQHEDEFEDTLGLAIIFDRIIRELSARGSNARVVHVDARSMPGAIRVSGRYIESAEGLRVTIVLRLGEVREELHFDGLRGSIEAVARQLTDRVIEASTSLTEAR